jgi:hypothetical protein
VDDGAAKRKNLFVLFFYVDEENALISIRYLFFLWWALELKFEETERDLSYRRRGEVFYPRWQRSGGWPVASAGDEWCSTSSVDFPGGGKAL